MCHPERSGYRGPHEQVFVRGVIMGPRGQHFVRGVSGAEGSAFELPSVSGHGFTGSGKPPSPEGYGLQPVHTPSKINARFSPRGMLFGLFPSLLCFVELANLFLFRARLYSLQKNSIR